MAGIFGSIPIVTVVLFGIGLVGVMVYERSRTRQSKEPEEPAA
jgi:NADH:ubiquinone oxidoreductase subunit K